MTSTEMSQLIEDLGGRVLENAIVIDIVKTFGDVIRQTENTGQKNSITREIILMCMLGALTSYITGIEGQERSR